MATIASLTAFGLAGNQQRQSKDCPEKGLQSIARALSDVAHEAQKISLADGIPQSANPRREGFAGAISRQGQRRKILRQWIRLIFVPAIWSN
jgi:hypothetical protein